MCDPSQFLPVDKHFETKAIHCGYNPEDNPSLGVVPPIILSTTFHQKDVNQLQHFKYGRLNNPNREMLEITVAALENGKYASCFASGIGAIAMTGHLVFMGEHILCVNGVYRGTKKYFEQIVSKRGVTITYEDFTNIETVDKNLRSNTKLVWIESPTNPLMKIFDIKAISKRVKEMNSKTLVVVDNSFLSPYFLRPLELGADLVVGSLTKYMNGHADVLMGVVVTNDEALHRTFAELQGVCGSVPSPFDCYMVTRGLTTLGIRMQTHMRSACKMADYLYAHPMVEKILYPGLPSHPGYNIAKEQWHGVGGMISFYIKGGLTESSYFVKSLRLFSSGVSYGGFESLVEIPILMSHRHVPREESIQAGVTGALIRLSIGLENIDDLIADVNSAFENVFRNRTQ